MAEVNAFSIDGERYQLTATDQTYVGETGLAQLGLDYTCTPDEMNQALADAGGGTVLVNGYELYSAGADGWGFDQDSANEDGTAQGIVCMRSAGVVYRSRLWLYGSTDAQGIRTRGTTSEEDATYDGTEWAILMYGRNDTWSPSDETVYCAGVLTSALTACTIPLAAPVAPGVTSVSCTATGNIIVRDPDGTLGNITSGTSKVSCTVVGNGVRVELSSITDSPTHVAVVSFSPSFTIKFL